MKQDLKKVGQFKLRCSSLAELTRGDKSIRNIVYNALKGKGYILHKQDCYPYEIIIFKEKKVKK